MGGMYMGLVQCLPSLLVACQAAGKVCLHIHRTHGSRPIMLSSLVSSEKYEVLEMGSIIPYEVHTEVCVKELHGFEFGMQDSCI